MPLVDAGGLTPSGRQSECSLPWQRENDNYDTPSDVEFGVWLMNLDYSTVKHDLMPVLSPNERFQYWWFVKYGKDHDG